MKTLLFIAILLPFVTLAQHKWTLEECITHAKKNNIEILKQLINNKKNTENIRIAKGNFLPNLSFSASQGFSLGNSFNISTGVGQSESSFNLFSLSSSVILFNGFNNKYKLQAEKIKAKKGEIAIESIVLDLSLAITYKYLQVLVNKEILSIAKEQKNISDQEVKRLSKLYQTGYKPKNELLQIQTTYELDKKEVFLAKNNLSNSLILLKELITINDIPNFDINLIEINIIRPTKILPNTEEKYNAIIATNPLLKIAQYSQDLSKKNLLISKSNYYPRLSFDYSFGSNYYHILGKKDLIFNQNTNRYDANSFFTQLKNNSINYLGLSLTVPIFNRFKTQSNIKKEKNEYELASIEIDKIKFQLKNKLILINNDILTAKTTLDASTKALKLQRENFNIMQKKYKKGIITSYEYLESKSKLLYTQSELIKSKYNYIFKLKLFEYYYQ